MSKSQDQIHKDKLSTDYKERLDDPKINEEDKHELHTTRGKLGIYSRVGLLGADSDGAIPLLATPVDD